MAPEPVVALPPLEGKFEALVHSRPHLPMMKANLLGKGARLPAPHAGRHYGHQVHAPAFDRSVAADGVEAFAPEKLASTRDMFDARESKIVGALALGKRRPTYA